MKKKYCFCALALTLQCGFSQAVTLEEALLAAYFHNKEWQGNQADKRSADAQFTQSKVAFLPSVEGSFSRSKARDRIEDQTSGTQNIGYTYGTNMGIKISQNLFNGFSTVNRMHASDHAARAAFYKMRIDEQKLITSVFNAYTGIWAGREKVRALRKKEENLRKTLSSQKSSLEAGVGTPSEVEQANANYQRAIFERINAETELFSAESEFEKITMLKADDKIDLPKLVLDIPENQEKLIQQALSSNCAIAYYKAMERMKEYELKSERGRLSPSVDLRLHSFRNLENKTSTNSKRYETIASLEVTVPIFANSPQGNSYSAIEIANQGALKARFTFEDAVLEIKKECIVNWNTYVSANAMIQSSQSAVRSAEVSSESNLEETALGLKSNTDVWVKENQLLESRVDLANSQRQKIMTAVKLLELSGRLSLNSILKKK